MGGSRLFYVNVTTVTGCDVVDSYFAAATGVGVRMGGSACVVKDSSVIRTATGLDTITGSANNYFGFNTFIQNTAVNVNFNRSAYTFRKFCI